MARQRIRTIGQVISDVRDIVLRPSNRIPKLTCSVCGKVFYYRGIEDADFVAGSTWDPEMQTYIPTRDRICLCNDCKIYGDIDYD